jgi:hypothetical protein
VAAETAVLQYPNNPINSSVGRDAWGATRKAKKSKAWETANGVDQAVSHLKALGES